MMSAPRAISISSAFSGERKCSEPSRCERKVTPSFVTLRNSLRLKTWKPPESVLRLALYGGSGADRHECGGVNEAMRRGEAA
jgi:hypothetical protein